MPYNKEQKIKLLVPHDLLCRNTDKEHKLKTKDFISKKGNYGIFRILGTNDGKSVAVYCGVFDARSYPRKRLDRCAECYRNLRRNEVYAAEGGDSYGGGIQFSRRFCNDADQ